MTPLPRYLRLTCPDCGAATLPRGGRLDLIHQFAQRGPLTSRDVADTFGGDVSAGSRDLARLASLGLLTRTQERAGFSMRYVYTARARTA